MSTLLQYTVLQYSPMVTFEKTVSLGVLFYDKEKDYREFRFREDLTPLTQMNDSADTVIIKKLLQSMKEDIESMQYFDIEEYIRFYLNSFRFDTIKSVQCKNAKEAIESIASCHIAP